MIIIVQYLESIFTCLEYKKCLQAVFDFLTTAERHIIILFYRPTWSVSFMLSPAEQKIELVSFTSSLSEDKTANDTSFVWYKYKIKVNSKYYKTTWYRGREYFFLLNIFNLLVLPFVFIPSDLSPCLDACLLLFIFYHL